MIVTAVLVAATFTRPLERVTTVDPVFAQTVYDSSAVKLIYETPLEINYDARPYQLSPGACELPEVSDDARVYRFRMRSENLSAADVVRSLRRLMEEGVASPNAWMMKDVESVDERSGEVEIRLKSRCHYFPWLMAMAPAAIMTSDGGGTGAYRLDSWWRNHEMTFVSRYGNTGFDTIRYLVVDDMSTKWLMFMKGEVDMLGDIPRDNWDAAVGADGRLAESLASAGVEMQTIPTLESIYIGFNMRDGVVGVNRHLRQALNAAFDYPAWERYHSGRVMAADGPIPPGVAGRLETPFEYAFNPELARSLMAEAGYADGIDPRTGRRLELALAIGRATQDSRESGELLASFYERIGVKLTLRFYTWDAFMKAMNDGRAQMFLIGWVGDYPDAQNFLQLFHSDNLPPGPNHSAYSNPEFDWEYNLAMEAADETDRDLHWARCQGIIREDCPWVFLHFNKSSSLMRSRVGNYVASCFPYGQERYFKVKEEE